MFCNPFRKRSEAATTSENPRKKLTGEEYCTITSGISKMLWDEIEKYAAITQGANPRYVIRNAQLQEAIKAAIDKANIYSERLGPGVAEEFIEGIAMNARYRPRRFAHKASRLHIVLRTGAEVTYNVAPMSEQECTDKCLGMFSPDTITTLVLNSGESAFIRNSDIVSVTGIPELIMYHDLTLSVDP